MSNHPNRSNRPSPRFKATYLGETLGWYDTAEEAQEAIDAARKQKRADDEAYYAAKRAEYGI